MLSKLRKWIIRLAILYVFLYFNNHWLVVSEHMYESDKVPAAFDGLRVVQVSDLHDALFGEGNKRLIDKIRMAEPDVIFITGDVVDSNRYNLQQSLQAVNEFVKIADVYYVLGNHEVATNQVTKIYKSLTELGVTVLSNDSLLIERGGQQVAIVGIEDPLMNKHTKDMLQTALVGVPGETMTLLLAHRPEKFSSYANANIDLVFSGHAHGGQVRIPGVGGLISPGQGYLPKYTSGIYEEADTKMVVSRGLGNSIVPFRILNLPEIVVVELKSK